MKPYRECLYWSEAREQALAGKIHNRWIKGWNRSRYDTTIGWKLEIDVENGNDRATSPVVVKGYDLFRWDIEILSTSKDLYNRSSDITASH
ncbi:hypothetical protein KQX54_012834 [Cotesia glomerata]|uniref:Uncharacterized protein n=1 Tax=Cotesia glomerata TaxID=32391 RepID=A0AAV7J3Z2_COTGL|nr:hypothetical protein KQX54_012834 [Cotesia glomerata]